MRIQFNAVSPIFVITKTPCKQTNLVLGHLKYNKNDTNLP